MNYVQCLVYMYKAREHILQPKMCRHHKEDNTESQTKEEKTMQLNGYDKVRSQVMESDADSWKSINQKINKKPLPKRKK